MAMGPGKHFESWEVSLGGRNGGTVTFPLTAPFLLVPFCEISAQRAARLHLHASWDEVLRPSEGSPAHFQPMELPQSSLC